MNTSNNFIVLGLGKKVMSCGKGYGFPLFGAYGKTMFNKAKEDEVKSSL